ncbi:Di-copper centre-containing protein [Apiospora rasikravindrae]|uniref:Di-copper centre-containing protein n=1 Tax=Apiospora rasikravindrae TaxID=990691 RepID=A0ABR1TBY6_9PEZI
MQFSSFLLSAGLCAAATIPREAAAGENACANPAKRVEWRTMDAAVQKQYIDAVKCLKTKPSGMGLNTTRYDDFPYVHTHLDTTIHTVAMFLPWHRLFVQVYEDSLRDCGYKGPMAYWDWTLDTADVTKAPVWDVETGFGGNGDPAIDPLKESSRKKCLVDGPLKGLEVAYTMGGYDPHCLARNWNSGIAFPGDMLADSYTKEVVDKVSAQATYADFRYELEGGPHGAIHSAVGGDMSPATSPNDPIFFLHHAQIDRLWTQWQMEKPETRTTEFGGPKTQDKEPGEASAEDVMPYLGLVPDVKVKEILATGTERLCYTY